MSNLEDKSTAESKFMLKETLTGLYIGILLMVFGFLFVHFVLGIKAFS